jgi:hypothetical protein
LARVSVIVLARRPCPDTNGVQFIAELIEGCVVRERDYVRFANPIYLVE